MNRFFLKAYPFAVLLLFLFFTASIQATVDPGGPAGPDHTGKNPVASELPVVGSYANLKVLLKEIQESGYNIPYRQKMAVMEASGAGSFDTAASAPATAVKSQNKAENKSKDYSGTNVQVQGVDEADVVKTDGEYIYQVNGQRVIIARAYPPEKMEVINTVGFPDENFTPAEIYVDQKYLAIIGNTYYNTPYDIPPEGPLPVENNVQAEKKVRNTILPPVYIHSTVKTIIFDISDRSEIKKVRETELDGNYISSRKIGSALYITANKYIDYYYIMEEKDEPPTPSYRDSATGSGFTGIDFPDIRYFPGASEPNYLMVAGLDLDSPEEEMEVSTYLGSGQNIYASQDNLYVAVTRYQPEGAPSTVVHRFALNSGKADYSGKGEVPGTILNQFSMDEYKGSFRIATTRGEVWRSDESTSKNNLYILDKSLKTTGKLEDIAPGEKIYSVRFMGERGYMVTFKAVDPLFVIDLADPKAPKILGALKIPGYSDYLHPYDENHIIGFGKDTIEVSGTNGKGTTSEPTAFYQGMKIALFDVSDVANPVEKFKEIIGDRGTDSELLRNHRALLFSRDKNLLAFPVTLMETGNSNTESPNKRRGIPEYGEFSYQGAYIYNLEPDTGFRLKGRITHLTGEDRKKSGRGWYESTRNVERILYIDNTLYTVSKGMIKANDLLSMEEKNSLNLPQ